MAALSTLHATIAKVNSTGFQTRERPGVWINLSKYATPTPEIPPVGTEVELAIDTGGFVREIRPLSSTQSVEKAPPAAPPTTESAEPVSTKVDIRVACLSAAATFLAPRVEAKSGDVLTLAERFEKWVAR